MTVAVCVACCLSSGVFAAAPRSDVPSHLKAVASLFNALEFDLALQHLDAARKVSSRKEDDLQIALYSGLIEGAMGHAARSDAAFRTALEIDPDARLPALAVSPKVKARFEQLKGELAQAGKSSAELHFARVLLFDVQAGGAPPAAVLKSFAQAVEAQLRKVPGLNVLSSEDLRLSLGAERTRQLLGGADRGGPRIDADEWVKPELSRSRGSYAITLQRVDARSGRVLQAPSRTLSSEDATNLADAAAELVGVAFGDHRAPAVAPPVPRPASKGTRPIRVAILDVQATGDIPDRALMAFRQSLAPEVRKLEGVSAISSNEISDMLGFERQKQLLGCSDNSASCLAELAGALDADEMLTFELSLVGSTYALTGKRLDLRRSAVVQSQTSRFDRRDGEELLGAVGPLVAALFPDRPLKPGRARGVESLLIRRLNPPPLPRWAFFTTAGLAVGAGAAAAIFAVGTLQNQREFSALNQSATTTAVPVSTLTDSQRRLDSSAKLTNEALVAAGGLALVAGIEAFFTDWHDDRAALAAQPVALTGGAGVAFAGAF